MVRGKQGDDLHNLERRLETWATKDMSDEATDRCNDLIDRLAGVQISDEKNDESPLRGKRKPWLWSSAAAIMLGLLTWFVSSRKYSEETGSKLVHADTPSKAEVSEFTLLRSVNRVDAREDDGLIIPSDGATPYYRYRYHVVDEEQVQDEISGTVITLRQPRLEILTVPVTQF